MTVEELRYELGRWESTAEGWKGAVSELVAVAMILCNRIGDVEHQLEHGLKLPRFTGETELKIALLKLEVGSMLIYMGVLHVVIDGGIQGNKIAAVPKTV